MIWLAVAVGGALGSVARHSVNHLVAAYALGARFPIATAVVNLVGCFVIGLLAGFLASQRIALTLPWREFIFVGILGGFTTFSTFGLDTFVLVRSHSAPLAALNIGLQVVSGLAAVWIGYRLGH